VVPSWDFEHYTVALGVTTGQGVWKCVVLDRITEGFGLVLELWPGCAKVRGDISMMLCDSGDQL